MVQIKVSLVIAFTLSGQDGGDRILVLACWPCHYDRLHVEDQAALGGSGMLATEYTHFFRSLFTASAIKSVFSFHSSRIFSVYLATQIMGTFKVDRPYGPLRNASLFLIFHISRFPRVEELGLSFPLIKSPHILRTFRRLSAHCVIF